MVMLLQTDMLNAKIKKSTESTKDFLCSLLMYVSRSLSPIQGKID